MKNKLLSVFALAAGLLLGSCAFEEVPVTETTILAVMENDQTRTSVTDEGSFTWSSGDQIWLHTTAGSVVGTLSAGAGTASASFSTGVFIGDLTGKAVYPYNSQPYPRASIWLILKRWFQRTDRSEALLEWAITAPEPFR